MNRDTKSTMYDQAPPPNYAPRPQSFDLDDVFGTTFSLLGAKFVPLVGLALVISVLNAAVMMGASVLGLAFASDVIADPTGRLVVTYIAAFGAICVSFVTGGWAQAVMLHQCVQHLSGQNAPFSASLSFATQRVAPVAIMSLLFGLMVTIGTAMCLLPGVAVAVIFLPAVAVVVTEQQNNPIEALGRAAQLTEGSRLTVFLILLLTVIGLCILACCVIMPLQWVLGFGAAAAGLGIGGAANSAALMGAGLFGAFGVMFLVQTILGAVLVAFINVLFGVIYARLRRSKEGVEIDQLASVFT